MTRREPRYRKEKSSFAQGFGAGLGAGLGYGCACFIVMPVLLVLGFFLLAAL